MPPLARRRGLLLHKNLFVFHITQPEKPNGLKPMFKPLGYPAARFIIVSVNPALEPPDSVQASEKELGLRRVFQQPARAADSSLSE
jgi:hypothetical protein